MWTPSASAHRIAYKREWSKPVENASRTVNSSDVKTAMLHYADVRRPPQVMTTQEALASGERVRSGQSNGDIEPYNGIDVYTLP